MYFWAFIENVAPLAISFVVSVLVARKVGPEAYGLIGMLSVFMALGQGFTELGFGAALVQRKDITSDDQTSVFVINLLAGLLITLTLCAISPLVATFFEHEVLVQLLCLQSLGIFIASTGLVQFALIYRRMKFRLAAMIEVLATVISGIVGVLMAYAGYGVWSLVWQGLSREAVRAAAAWVVGGWRPRGKFSKERLAAIWDYSSKLVYSSLLHRIVTNLYSVIIGKIFPPAALGLYTRASGLQAIPGGLAVGIVQRVAFPLFSKHQDDKGFLLFTIRKNTRILVLWVAIMMGLLAVLSENLILWMLGKSWLGAVPLLKILCLSGVFAAAFGLHSKMTMALGESRLFFKIELLKKVAILIILAAVYRFGLLAFAWSAVALSFSDFFLSSYPSIRLIGYTRRMQTNDLAPSILLCGIVGLLLLNLPWDSSLSPLALMALKTALFIALTGMGLFAFRKVFFQDAWELVCNLPLGKLKTA